MNYQVLFSLKNNEKIFRTVICCSRDWRLKGQGKSITFEENQLFHFHLFSMGVNDERKNVSQEANSFL